MITKKSYVLLFYFFCWIGTRIDVALAAEKEETTGRKIGLQLEEDFSETKKEEGAEAHGETQTELGDIEKLTTDVKYLDILQIYSFFENRSEPLKQLNRLLMVCPFARPYRVQLDKIDARHILKPLRIPLRNFIFSIMDYVDPIKNNLQILLPPISHNEKRRLEKQYNRFLEMDWSYSDINVPVKADGIFQDMTWEGPEPHKKLTNVKLYHELYHKINTMKSELFKLQDRVQVAESLRSFITKIPSFISYSPLFDANEETKQAMMKAFHTIEMLNIKLAENLWSKKTAENPKSLIELRDNLIYLLNQTNIYISMKINDFKINMQEIRNVENDTFLERMLAHYYIKINELFMKQFKDITFLRENVAFGELYTTLNNAYIEVTNEIEQTFKESHKALTFTKCESIYEDLPFREIAKKEMESDESMIYSSLVDLFLKINNAAPLKKSLERLIRFMNNFTYVYDNYNKSSYCKMEAEILLSSFKQDMVYHTQSFFHNHKNAHQAILHDTTLTSHLKIFNKLHSKVRMLQYHWGNACDYCKKIKTDPSCVPGGHTFEDYLKKIALNFYNSLITMEEIAAIFQKK